jgi:hypothetical protein
VALLQLLPQIIFAIASGRFLIQAAQTVSPPGFGPPEGSSKPLPALLPSHGFANLSSISGMKQLGRHRTVAIFPKAFWNSGAHSLGAPA